MEKDVEKIYNDVLDSINCENDDFINSYFEDDDITDEMQGNTMEDDDFDDEWVEEIDVHQENVPVENYVDNIGEIAEFEEKQEELNVENYENNFNNNDFESLLASSEEFDNVMIEPVESIEIQDNFIENEIKVVPEELVIEESSADEIPEIGEEKEEFTTDDLLELIEETDNSEEFFEKLEDRLDD